MMSRSRKRRMITTVVALVVALAVVLAPLLLFWPSAEEIVIGEDSWTMPGGGPQHLSYLPLAPQGPLRERWNTRLEGALAGPPAVAGERIYASCENGLLYSLDLESGKPVWRFDAGSELTSMPAVSEAGVFLGTPDGRVLCVGPGGDLNWESEVGGAVVSTPIPAGDRVYFGSSDRFVYCVDAASGSEIWSFQAEGPVEVSPCLYEGQVYATSFEGDLFALDARDGRLVWTYHSQDVPMVLPAADDGRVFQATEFGLHCIDTQSGKLLWEYATGVTVISNLAIRGNQLIVVDGSTGTDSRTLSLDARTGDVLWEAPSGYTTDRTELLASNEDIYMCGIDYLRAFAIESGTPSLESEIRGVLPHTMTVTKVYVLVGTDSRKVYCLEK